MREIEELKGKLGKEEEAEVEFFLNGAKGFRDAPQRLEE